MIYSFSCIILHGSGPAILGNRLMKPLVKILDFGFQKALSFYFRLEKFPPEFLRIAVVVFL